MLAAAKPASELIRRFPSQADLIEQAIADTQRSVDGLKYLPLVARDIGWTILLDASSAEVVGFLPIDSF